MADSKLYDSVVIGGGIVGMATAMALSGGDGGRSHRGEAAGGGAAGGSRGSVVVLEAEDRLAAHQTGHNSGVIHSGLYYKPGSLKARNCVEGRVALVRFCEEHGLPFERCGKLVVASTPDELPRLAELEARGVANGLQGLRRVPAEGIGEWEPHATGLAALWVPETGIVDYKAVTEAFGRQAREQGATVRTKARVIGFRRLPGEIVLETTAGEVRARGLINCGGLGSDRLARLCGVDPGLRIVPFKGEYHELVPGRTQLVKNLIYPVPDPRFPFLGVHFTRMIHGGVEAGPNAVLSFKREGYARFSFDAKDTWDVLTYPAAWKMAARYWRTGLGEVVRSLSTGMLVRSLQALVPEIQVADVHRSGAGIRAQAVDLSGRLVDDFRIVEADRMIHVLNAPSPAATASISIGRTIAEMAVGRWA